MQTPTDWLVEIRVGVLVDPTLQHSDFRRYENQFKIVLRSLILSPAWISKQLCTEKNLNYHPHMSSRICSLCASVILLSYWNSLFMCLLLCVLTNTFYVCSSYLRCLFSQNFTLMFHYCIIFIYDMFMH